MKKTIITFTLALVTLSPAAALATPTEYGGGWDLNLYNAANLLLGGGTYASNAALETAANVNNDHFWTKLGSGNIVLLGRSAGNTLNLGVFTNSSNPAGSKTQLASGLTGFGYYGDGLTAGTSFIGANDALPLFGDFGFYVESNGYTTGNVTQSFYSFPSQNPGSLDHLVAYHLTGMAGKKFYVDGVLKTFTANSYLLGFEDTPGGGDTDYNDIMFLIDGYTPSFIQPAVFSPLATTYPGGPSVPEPSTFALLALGLAGAGFLRKKFRS